MAATEDKPAAGPLSDLVVIEMADHPRWPGQKMQNVFPKLSETPGSVRSQAPQAVGQDNAEILGRRLGLTAQEIGSLDEAGVI